MKSLPAVFIFAACSVSSVSASIAAERCDAVESQRPAGAASLLQLNSGNARVGRSVCPPLYDHIDKNLDGTDKSWSFPASKTIEGCAETCNDRAGCTGFEFNSGGNEGFKCATYTGGEGNIRASPATAQWTSCIIMEARRQSTIEVSTTLPRDDASAAKDWWDKDAEKGFQHIDRSYVTDHMEEWQAFLPKFHWSGKSVLDYGIGGGYLGETLFKNYSIGSYIGVDISQKSLDAATKVLEPWAQQVQLLLTPQRFGALTPQIFVSQQVIQHFPSDAYFEEFLENVDVSGASELMLHFRVSRDGSTVSNHAYTPEGGEKAFALVTSVEFIAQRLPRYRLMWSDFRPMCCGTKGQYTGWKLKAEGALSL